MATQVASLFTALTLENANFVSNMKRSVTIAEESGRKISTAINVAGAAIAAFAATEFVNKLLGMAGAATDFASSIAETAEQVGVSAKSLQELRFAALQSGASIEEADKAIGKFSVNVGKAREGNKGLRDAFADVGVSVQDLKTLGTEELFAKVADGIAKIPDPARRAADEVALLGKGGLALAVVLDGGSAGLQAFADQAGRLGIVVSDKALVALDNMKDSGDRLKLAFDARLANLIGNNADAILNLGGAAVETLGKLDTLINRLKGVRALSDSHGGGAAGTLTEIFQNNKSDVNGASTTEGRIALFSKEVSELQQAIAAGKGRIAQSDLNVLKERLRQQQGFLSDEQTDKLSGLTQIGIPKLGGSDKNYDTKDDVTKGGRDNSAAKAAEEAKRNADEMAASLKTLVGGYDDVAAAVFKYRTELDTVARLQKAGFISTDYAEALKDQASKAQADAFRKEATAARNQLFADNDKLLPTRTLAEIKPDGKAKSDLKEMDKDLDHALRASEQFTENLSYGLADALVSGKSLGDVLVNSLKRAAVEAVAGGLFKLLGGTSGGTGIVSFFAGLFGGARASGGPTDGGKTYLVGEQGPELFRSGSSGTIIPNHALKSANGNGNSQTRVTVDVTPSPLFVTTVRTVAGQSGAQAAGAVIANERRRTIPRGRG